MHFRRRGACCLGSDSGIVAVTLHHCDRFGGDNEVLSKQLISEVQAWHGRTLPSGGQ